MLTRKKKAVSLHSKSVGLVAQLDRVPDYGSGGCGFDSRPVHERKSAKVGFLFLYTNLHESFICPRNQTKVIVKNQQQTPSLHHFWIICHFNVLSLRVMIMFSCFKSDVRNCLLLSLSGSTFHQRRRHFCMFAICFRQNIADEDVSHQRSAVSFQIQELYRWNSLRSNSFLFLTLQIHNFLTLFIRGGRMTALTIDSENIKYL